MFDIGFRSYINRRDLDVARKAGIQVLEIMYEDVTRARQDEVKALLEEYGIRPSAALIYPQRDLAQLKEDIDFAQRVRCPVYCGHPQPLRWADREAIGEFRAFWTQACAYGADHGVKVAVHSCGLGPESWDIMFHEVPDLYLKYDPSFSAAARRDYRAEILRYGSRIVHFHAKDEIFYGNVGDGGDGVMPVRYVPPGMGEIHWGSVIACLYEAEYRGDIAIEVHSTFWMSDAQLLRGLVIAKRHLEQFMA